MGNQIDLEKRSLLVVEDEPGIQQIIVELLEDLDIRIMTAENGREALNIIEQNNFDAILCDIMMPHLTGIELLEEVRRKNIVSPFIFLTAFADQSLVLQAMRLGAIDFLIKPFNEEELYNVVERAVEIGVRRKFISQSENDPKLQDQVKRSQKMISLFHLAIDKKRSKSSK